MFLYSLVLTCFFVLVFVILLLNVNQHWLLNNDNRVSNYIIDNFRNRYLDFVFYYLDKIYIGIIIFLYFLFSIYYYRTHPSNKLEVVKELFYWPVLFIVIPTTLVLTLASFIKHALKRERPYIKPIKRYDSHSYSFPSIHAASSSTIVSGLFFLVTFTLSLYNYYPATSSLALLIIALILCHITICYSRIYLGVHYVSDVIGGTFFSMSVIGMLITIFTAVYRV